VVSDSWQRQGLGTLLLEKLIQAGRNQKLDRISATILPDNTQMQHLARKAGFELRHDPFSPEMTAILELEKAAH
jgi:acetyltransferase